MERQWRLHPRRVNEPLQGSILQELLDSACTTSDLAAATRQNLAEVRRELISLHHLGVILPVGIREDTSGPGARLYYRDYLWAISDHGMSHHTSVAGCIFCKLRERILLRAGGYEP